MPPNKEADKMPKYVGTTMIILHKNAKTMKTLAEKQKLRKYKDLEVFRPLSHACPVGKVTSTFRNHTALRPYKCILKEFMKSGALDIACSNSA